MSRMPSFHELLRVPFFFENGALNDAYVSFSKNYLFSSTLFSFMLTVGLVGLQNDTAKANQLPAGVAF